MKISLKQLIGIFRRNKTVKEAILGRKPCNVTPFSVVLVKRTTGPHAKRGIHSTTETLDNVIGMKASEISPFTIFNFADGHQMGIHHDRLLEVRSHVQK